MCLTITQPEQTNNIMDLVFKFATLLIAIFNAYFAYVIFRHNDSKDNDEKERDRKIQLLKTLILDHSFKNFYMIFDEIEKELENLKQQGLIVENKQTIDDKIQELFIKLRRKFYDSLLAIDDNLYETIKTKCDELQSHLTNTIFDQGVNLSHSPKYEELVYEKLIEAKTEVIKTLFSYRGD